LPEPLAVAPANPSAKLARQLSVHYPRCGKTSGGCVEHSPSQDEVRAGVCRCLGVSVACWQPFATDYPPKKREYPL